MTIELQIGMEYYWKRTSSWKWLDGREHWWEVFIEVRGQNGVGGYWLYERWRWNGSSENLRTEVRTLGWVESQMLRKEIAAANPELLQKTGKAEEIRG